MTGQEYINTRALHPFWDESRDPNKEDVIDAFEQGKAEGVKEGKEQLPAELEEAAKKYKSQWDIEHPHSPDIDFIAGAEWQYQKDRGEFAKIKAKTWCEGFDACKEQMMEGAVEGEIQMRYS